MTAADGPAAGSGGDACTPGLRPSQASAKLCTNTQPCRFGERCMFAHSQREAAAFLAARARGALQRAPARPPLAGAASMPALGLFKTKLCTHWERAGRCSRGEQCAFAHGEAELRPRPPPRPAFLRSASAPDRSPPAASAGASAGSSASASCADAASDAGAAAAAAAVAGVTSWADAEEGAEAGSGSEESEVAVAAWADDEALALQLQFDEHQRLAEQVRAAQRQRQPSPCCATGSGSGRAAGQMPAPLAAPLAGSESGDEGGSCGGKGDAEGAGADGDAGSEAGSEPATACSSEATPRRTSIEDGSCAPDSEEELAAEEEEEEEEGEEAEEAGAASDEAAEGGGWDAAAEEDGWRAEAATPAPLPLQPGQQQQAQQAQQQWVQWQGAYGQAAVMWRVHPSMAPYGSPTAAGCYAVPTPFHEQHVAQAQQQQRAAAAVAHEWASPPSAAGTASGRSSAAGYRSSSPGGAAQGSGRGCSLLQRSIAAGTVDPLSLVPSFVCPLTRRPFVNPVVAADGLTYEQEALTDWLRRRGAAVSPLTGQPLAHQVLVANTALRGAMEEVAELVGQLVGA